MNKRKYGVLQSGSQNGNSNKLSERFYYVQDPTKIRFASLCKGTKGWIRNKSQTRNGIQHHYNFRADPALGPGYVAVRRIPCACNACVSQLKEPWLSNKEFHDQPRYRPNNQECLLWPIMEDLNNWLFIKLIDIKPGHHEVHSEVTKSIFQSTLQNRALSMISVIEEGNYGAVSTTDEKAISGYYLCIFKSCAYILQDNFYNDTERIAAGDLVCDITWLNPVPHCKTMFSHGLKDETTLDSTIRVQHIVHEKLDYCYLQSPDQLPKTMRNQFNNLIMKNTIIINDTCHDNIVETIHTRNHLDYEEYIESSDDFNESEEEFDNDY